MKLIKNKIQAAFDELKQILMAVDKEYTEKIDLWSRSGCVIRIKPEMVGCVIGKQGSHIKHVEDQTGVKIKIERK